LIVCNKKGRQTIKSCWYHHYVSHNMENQDEIFRIVKKSVEENEKFNKYTNVRDKINKIKDFRNLTNDHSTKTDSKSEERFDVDQELQELQNLYDIQTKQAIETGKRGLIRPLALKFRNLIQNEIRFTLDPIIEKQVFFNEKFLKFASSPELMDQISNTSADQQEYLDILNNKLDQVIQKSVINQKIISKLNLLFEQNQELFTTLLHKKPLTKPKTIRIKKLRKLKTKRKTPKKSKTRLRKGTRKLKQTKRKRSKKVRIPRRKSRVRT